MTSFKTTKVGLRMVERIDSLGESSQINGITARTITTKVRSPRFALLIDIKSPYWKAHISGAIQSFSQTWGGEHFIIVPTDGKTIDEVFWNILKKYSPDYIGRYIPCLADLKEADEKTIYCR